MDGFCTGKNNWKSITLEALTIQVINGGTDYIKNEMDKVIQSLFRRL